jgi:hypothetical protein
MAQCTKAFVKKEEWAMPGSGIKEAVFGLCSVDTNNGRAGVSSFGVGHNFQPSIPSCLDSSVPSCQDCPVSPHEDCSASFLNALGNGQLIMQVIADTSVHSSKVLTQGLSLLGYYFTQNKRWWAFNPSVCVSSC